jgi:hypothetical protein
MHNRAARAARAARGARGKKGKWGNGDKGCRKGCKGGKGCKGVPGGGQQAQRRCEAGDDGQHVFGPPRQQLLGGGAMHLLEESLVQAGFEPVVRRSRCDVRLQVTHLELPGAVIYHDAQARRTVHLDQELHAFSKVSVLVHSLWKGAIETIFQKK